jgi:hypothetical protein
MLAAFKLLCFTTESGAMAQSPDQLSPDPTAPPESETKDILLGSLATLSRLNGVSVLQHDARITVIGELLVSMLAYLPAAMRADIVETFRSRIEKLMSMGDDNVLPQPYLEALLTEVNRYLNVLR